MRTSRDSSPIGAHTEYPEHHPSLQSNKTTPKIDKVVMKIKAANTDSAMTIGPKEVFLYDSTLNTAKNIEKHKAELLAIEIDCDRIQREQANIITIIPSEPRPNKSPEQRPKESANEYARHYSKTLNP